MKHAAVLLVVALAVSSLSGCGTTSGFTGNTVINMNMFSDGEAVEPGDADRDIPWGKDVSVEPMPAIFKDRGRDRLLAEEAARQDASRKLLERISGVAVDAQTDVHDLVVRSALVKAHVEGKLAGMRTVATRYYDDGRVEVMVRVWLREVMEALQSSCKSVREDERLVSESALEDVRRQSGMKFVEAVGRSALSGSEGLRKVRAMRAAEVDCYARLAARVSGLEITGATTVADLAARSDAVASKVSVLLLSGSRFSDYRFAEDGTCSVTGTLTLRRVVDSLTRTIRRHGRGTRVSVTDVQNLTRTNRDEEIVEVGRGAIPAAADAAEAVPQTEEKKTVIERVIRREIVVQ